MNNRRNESREHKGIPFSYTISGGQNRFSGQVIITWHRGNHTEEDTLVLNDDFPTLELAENAVIELAREHIDNNL